MAPRCSLAWLLVSLCACAQEAPPEALTPDAAPVIGSGGAGDAVHLDPTGRDASARPAGAVAGTTPNPATASPGAGPDPRAAATDASPSAAAGSPEPGESGEAPEPSTRQTGLGSPRIVTLQASISGYQALPTQERTAARRERYHIELLELGQIFASHAQSPEHGEYAKDRAIHVLEELGLDASEESQFGFRAHQLLADMHRAAGNEEDALAYEEAIQRMLDEQ